MKKDAIIGIPQRGERGDPTQGLKPGSLVTYALQRHHTARKPGNPHLDLRLGTSETGLYSWAIPKGELPSPGERHLAPQTDVHTHAYGAYTGKIGKGYGEGNVERADLGEALITKTTPNSVHFTLAHTKVPTRYMLTKMDTERGNEWLLIGKPVGRKDVPGLGEKLNMKKIDAADLDEALAKAQDVQAKIDGAASIFDIDPTGKLEAYSVRKNVAGDPITHTERLGLSGLKIPSLRGTAFRGEAYYVSPKTQKALPFRQISGLLNAALDTSLRKQKELGVVPEIAPYSVIQHKGQPVTGLSPDAERAMLESIVKDIGSERFRLPERATEPEEKAKLVEDVIQGRNPRTEEGVVLKSDGKYQKYVQRPSITGYLRGTYPGIGKRKATAGGLLASLAPEGEPNIRLGTGYTDAELKDIATNLKEHMGKPIRIEHKGVMPSGLLRAPSYRGIETDSDVPKAASEEKEEPYQAVDLDGTLSKHTTWKGHKHIGEPVPKMVERVKRWLRDGTEVKILTARAAHGKKAIKRIRKWCKKNIGQKLEVTNEKTPGMIRLWDDKAVAVEKNTGEKKAADIPTKAEIDVAAAKADTKPSEAQKETGNYQKGHIKIHGLDITIENPKGSVRSGTNSKGEKWSTKLESHYGYIKGTSDKDADHTDVFIGSHPESHMVFIVDQIKPDGSFDEHKVMLGYRTVKEAKEGYLANYEKGWKGLGEVTTMFITTFKKWLKDGDTTKPAKGITMKKAQEQLPSPQVVGKANAIVTTAEQQQAEKEHKHRILRNILLGVGGVGAGVAGAYGLDKLMRHPEIGESAWRIVDPLTKQRDYRGALSWFGDQPYDAAALLTGAVGAGAAGAGTLATNKVSDVLSNIKNRNLSPDVKAQIIEEAHKRRRWRVLRNMAIGGAGGYFGLKGLRKLTGRVTENLVTPFGYGDPKNNPEQGAILRYAKQHPLEAAKAVITDKPLYENPKALASLTPYELSELHRITKAQFGARLPLEDAFFDLRVRHGDPSLYNINPDYKNAPLAERTFTINPEHPTGKTILNEFRRAVEHPGTMVDSPEATNAAAKGSAQATPEKPELYAQRPEDLVQGSYNYTTTVAPGGKHIRTSSDPWDFDRNPDVVPGDRLIQPNPATGKKQLNWSALMRDYITFIGRPPNVRMSIKSGEERPRTVLSNAKTVMSMEDVKRWTRKAMENKPVKEGRMLTEADLRAAAEHAKTKQASAKAATMIKEVPLTLVKGVRPITSVMTEVAATPESRSRGLGKRAALPDGHGMFFDVPGPFWMKDVSFPLDIIFLDKKGTVLEKLTMPISKNPWFPLEIYSTKHADAACALEVPAGWCKQHDVQPGDRLIVDKGA